MRAKFKRNRKFFPPGYSHDFEGEVELIPYSLPCLADALLNQFLPNTALANATLEDLKGADLQRRTITDGLGAEELFFVSGNIPVDLSATYPNALKEPFSIGIYTNFDSFQDPHHIVHKSRTERSGSLPQDFPVDRIGRSVPLHLERLRLGMEFFESRFMTNFFGFSPVVQQVLQLEADTKKVKLIISVEWINEKHREALSRHATLPRLEKLLLPVTTSNVVEEYRQKLRSNS